MPLTAAARLHPETLLQRLKRETAALHTQIECVVDILRPDVSRAQYISYLATFRGYFVPVEKQLQNLPGLSGILPDMARRWKAPRIEEDLRALGMSEPALLALPCCEHVPALATVARALGCLYVLEGSTLGGRIIQRTLRARLPAELAAASSYLDCYGADTGAMWSEFGLRLTASAESIGNEDEMVAAAIETFSTLEKWFAEAGDGKH